MRRLHLPVGLALVLVLVVVRVPWPGADVDAQDWRASQLASFDEAWQAIDETYPDPTFGGLDWKGVKRELRPKAEAARSADDVRAVIREMIGRLGQSHFALITQAASGAPRGASRVPIDLRVAATGFVIVRVVPGSSAARAGLEPGQFVRRVDGEPSSTWLEQAEGADPRARAVDALRRSAVALSGPDGSEALLEIEGPAGDLQTRSVARERERGEVVTFGNLPPLVVRVEAAERRTPAGRSAGLIAFSVWMPAASGPIDQAVDRFRAAAGLVIDLRGNPGGIVEMMRGVAGHIIDEPVSLGRVQTRQATLTLAVNPRRATRDGRVVTPFSGPVAVLVDELTASASECFAGSLQSIGRARIFGRQTMGQALPASTRQLPSGDVLMHVLGDFVTPTGVRIEGPGVMPDEVVPLVSAALSGGGDPVLDAALAWIDRESGS